MSRISADVIALICFLAGASVFGDARATSLSNLVAGSATVHVGDIFTIPISIEHANSLNSFQFDLGFDPTIVMVLGADDSSTDFAVASGGFLTGLSVGAINNAIGLDSGVADSFGDWGFGADKRAGADALRRGWIGNL